MPFHPNTELLIDYWRQRSAGRPAPTRADIDPADFRELMPQTFMLGRASRGDYPLRLVGGFVADLHRKPLRGASGLAIWAPIDRIAIQTALELARRGPHPIIARAEAIAGDGLTLDLEILFAPLEGPTGEIDRWLGLYQPLTPVAWLNDKAVTELRLVDTQTAGGEEPRLTLAAVDGRRIA
jgi:hypothetical protein